MAKIRTITVGDVQRLVAGLPADQPFLLVGEDGFAYTVADLHPRTVTDTATGQKALTVEFARGSTCYGFGGPIDEIDSREGIEEP